MRINLFIKYKDILHFNRNPFALHKRTIWTETLIMHFQRYCKDIHRVSQKSILRKIYGKVKIRRECNEICQHMNKIQCVNKIGLLKISKMYLFFTTFWLMKTEYIFFFNLRNACTHFYFQWSCKKSTRRNSSNIFFIKHFPKIQCSETIFRIASLVDCTTYSAC